MTHKHRKIQMSLDPYLVSKLKFFQENSDLSEERLIGSLISFLSEAILINSNFKLRSEYNLNDVATLSNLSPVDTNTSLQILAELGLIEDTQLKKFNFHQGFSSFFEVHFHD
jgi:hypothetical protein